MSDKRTTKFRRFAERHEGTLLLALLSIAGLIVTFSAGRLSATEYWYVSIPLAIAFGLVALRLEDHTKRPREPRS